MINTFGRIVTIFCFVSLWCMVTSNHGEQRISKISRRTSSGYSWHLLHMMRNLQEEVRDVRREMRDQHKQIAFTAAVDEYGQRITHRSQLVKYKRVLFNIGGGYHKNSGHFVAPVKGTYVFFFSVELTPGTKGSFYITVNNRNTVEAVSGKVPNEYNMSSNMVIVSLRQGDHVYVMSHPSWSVDPRQHLMYKANTFSGFLLYH